MGSAATFLGKKISAVSNAFNSKSKEEEAQANFKVGGPPPKRETALPPAQAMEAMKFLTNPIAYMNRKVIVPTSNAQVGDIIHKTTVLDRFFSMANKAATVNQDVLLMEAGQKIRFAKLVPEDDIIRLNVSSEDKDGYIPMYFLPWVDQGIVELAIPEIPARMDKTNYGGFPQFFFTSGLSGCTIFVKGTSVAPVVYHAGVSNVGIHGNSDDFWKEQMEALNTGYDKAALKSIVKSSEYLPGDRASVKEYLDWLDAPSKKDLSLEIIECTACVFGIRTDRDWKFYVQERINGRVIRVLSAGDVVKENGAYHTVAGKGGVIVEKTKVPRRIGRFQFGTKVNKSFKVVERTVVRPIGVREIFPKHEDAVVRNKYTIKASII